MKSLNIIDIFAFKSVASNAHRTLPIHDYTPYLTTHATSTLSAALKHGLFISVRCVCAQASWMWIGNGYSINHRPKYKWFPTTGLFTHCSSAKYFIWSNKNWIVHEFYYTAHFTTNYRVPILRPFFGYNFLSKGKVCVCTCICVFIYYFPILHAFGIQCTPSWPFFPTANHINIADDWTGCAYKCRRWWHISNSSNVAYS